MESGIDFGIRDPADLTFREKKTLFSSISNADNGTPQLGRALNTASNTPSSLGPFSEKHYHRLTPGTVSEKARLAPVRLFGSDTSMTENDCAAVRHVDAVEGQHVHKDILEAATQTDSLSPAGPSSIRTSPPHSPDLVALLWVPDNGNTTLNHKQVDIYDSTCDGGGEAKTARSMRAVADLLGAYVGDCQREGGAIDTRLAEALLAAQTCANAESDLQRASAGGYSMSTGVSEGGDRAEALSRQASAPLDMCSPFETGATAAMAAQSGAHQLSGGGPTGPLRLLAEAGELREQLRQQALRQYENNRVAATAMEHSLDRLHRAAARAATLSPASSAAPVPATPATPSRSTPVSGGSTTYPVPVTTTTATSCSANLGPLDSSSLEGATAVIALTSLSRQRDQLAAQCARLQRQCSGLLSYIAMLNGNSVAASLPVLRDAPSALSGEVAVVATSGVAARPQASEQPRPRPEVAERVRVRLVLLPDHEAMRDRAGGRMQGSQSGTLGVPAADWVDSWLAEADEEADEGEVEAVRVRLQLRVVRAGLGPRVVVPYWAGLSQGPAVSTVEQQEEEVMPGSPRREQKEQEQQDEKCQPRSGRPLSDIREETEEEVGGGTSGRRAKSNGGGVRWSPQIATCAEPRPRQAPVLPNFATTQPQQPQFCEQQPLQPQPLKPVSRSKSAPALDGMLDGMYDSDDASSDIEDTATTFLYDTITDAYYAACAAPTTIAAAAGAAGAAAASGMGMRHTPDSIAAATAAAASTDVAGNTAFRAYGSVRGGSGGGGRGSAEPRRVPTPPCSPRSPRTSPCSPDGSSTHDPAGSLLGSCSLGLAAGGSVLGGGAGFPAWEEGHDEYDLADSEWEELAAAAAANGPGALLSALAFLREQLQLAHLEIVSLTTQLGALSHQREGMRARATQHHAALEHLAMSEGEALLEARRLRAQLAVERAARARLTAQCEELQGRVLMAAPERPHFAMLPQHPRHPHPHPSTTGVPVPSSPASLPLHGGLSAILAASASSTGVLAGGGGLSLPSFYSLASSQQQQQQQQRQQPHFLRTSFPLPSQLPTQKPQPIPHPQAPPPQVPQQQSLLRGLSSLPSVGPQQRHHHPQQQQQHHHHHPQAPQHPPQRHRSAPRQRPTSGAVAAGRASGEWSAAMALLEGKAAAVAITAGRSAGLQSTLCAGGAAGAGFVGTGCLGRGTKE